MFEKGNQHGKKRKGQKYKTIKGLLTKIQLRDLTTIDDLTRLALTTAFEGLSSSDLEIRLQTLGIVGKWIFTTKKENLHVSGSIEDYLKAIETGKPLPEIRSKPENTTFEVIPQIQPENDTSQVPNVAFKDAPIKNSSEST